MKITPVITGQPALQNPILNERTSPERLAQARSVAETGVRLTPSETPVDPQVLKAQENMRRIKMKVNISPDRTFEEEAQQAVPEAVPEQPEPETQSAISGENEAGLEETKPLSPQFAALAKQRRALQVKERELMEREKALGSSPTGGVDLAAQLKSQPLRVLQDQGVLTPEFYNSLTEFLVSGQSGINPEIQALKDEIKALKEGVDRNFIDRDQAAETQVLSEMRREAEVLSADGDTYELIRETRSVPKVIDLIHRTYKESGEVLDVREAMQLIEDALFEDALRYANFKKIQQRAQPEQPPMQPQRPMMRTLTNRDSAAAPLDRRTRAMMAALGTLKR